MSMLCKAYIYFPKLISFLGRNCLVEISNSGYKKFQINYSQILLKSPGVPVIDLSFLGSFSHLNFSFIRISWNWEWRG